MAGLRLRAISPFLQGFAPKNFQFFGDPAAAISSLFRFRINFEIGSSENKRQREMRFFAAMMVVMFHYAIAGGYV